MELKWEIFIGPLIGALIGYFTNLIAVKMLFFPTKEYRIGKFRVPFTPGIIPKEKGRIARKLGNAISSQLLTGEDLQESFLSEKVKLTIKNEVNSFIETVKVTDKSIKEACIIYIGLKEFDKKEIEIKKLASKSVINKVQETNLSSIISSKIANGIKEKMSINFLTSMFVSDKFISDLEVNVRRHLDEYINTDGKTLIELELSKTIDDLLSYKLSALSSKVLEDDIDYGKMVADIYEKKIMTWMKKIIEQLDLGAVVENKIISMNIVEVEEMLVSILKNEFSAIVNLGAVIGFILGLVMIWF